MDTAAPSFAVQGTINPETGKAPERRFINPNDKANGEWIHAHISKFRMVGDTKDLERQEVEAMLRHAPPYDSQSLRAMNMENMPNSTMGELPRRVSEDEGKWTDYVVSSSGLWQINFPDLPGQISSTFQEQVSELINRLWMDDCRHALALQLAFRQLSCYGTGPLVWIDCYDPTPIARCASDLRFPPDTRITLDNFTECSLKDTCTPQDMYATIRGEVGKLRSDLHGWNRTEVTKVLKAHALGEGSSVVSSIWDSLEQVELAERRGVNIWDNYKSSSIPIIHVWVKEYEPDEAGNVYSHIVLAPDGARWRVIRDKGYAYKTPKQFIALASDRVGSDMTVSGLRGMALDLLEHCRSMDIMHCASMYAAFRSSIPVYSSNGSASANAADQIAVRPNGVVIPMGFTEVQPHVDPQAGGWMIDRLSNHADRYQGVYDINSPNKGGVQRTAKEAVFDAAKEADARSNQILPIVRLFFEPLGREFVRRLFEFPKQPESYQCLKYKGHELAQEFWDAIMRMCNENGVPVIMLKNHRVVINPSNTPGGLDKKLMRANAVLPFYPMLQSAMQRNWVANNALIAIYGHQAAKPYLNKDEILPPADLSLLLDSENADMVSGYQRRVLPEQDHLAHLGPLSEEGIGHIPFTMQKLKEIQQGVFEKFSLDPLEALGEQLRAGVTLKGHIDAHLSMLAQNEYIMNMPEVQGYFDFSAQMENILIQTIKSFEQQAAERMSQTGDGLDPKTAAILQKTQAEIQAMKLKTEADIQMSQQKHNFKLGNQAQTAQARRDEKQAKFILDEVVKAKEADVNLAIQSQQHAMDIKAQNVQLEIQKKAAEELQKAKAKSSSSGSKD
jgi:hypothetical protein